MIDYRNPYTPEAGVMPKYLAGRDDILETASSQIKALYRRLSKPVDCFIRLEGRRQNGFTQCNRIDCR